MIRLSWGVLSLWLLLWLYYSPAFAGEAGTFTVCWWNVESFGVTDRFINNHHVEAAMKPESELRAVGAILRKINPDLLAVAEIVREPQDKYLKYFVMLLKDHGLDYPYVTTTTGSDERIQTVLLSRYPFTRIDHWNTDTFPATLKSIQTGETMKIRKRLSRGILHAEVKVSPELTLTVMAVHLKSRLPALEIEGEQAEGITRRTGEQTLRDNEAIILRKHLTEVLEASPQKPLLLLGDFNDALRSRALKTILGEKGGSPRLWPLALADYLGDQWTHYYYPDQDYSRIDDILVNEVLEKRNLPDKSYLYRAHEGDSSELNAAQASDHRPLVAVFRK